MVEGHVSAAESEMATGHAGIYESSLTVNPLRATNGTIVFTLTASSQLFTIGTNTSSERFITFLCKMNFFL